MKSLEHIIRQMNEETSTQKREKVKYVARPDDAKPTDEKSKLGRLAVTKTNVIDEDGEPIKISGKKTEVLISPDENNVEADKKEKIDDDAKGNKTPAKKEVKEAVGTFANSPTIGVPKNKFTKGKPEQTTMKNAEGTPGQLTDDVQMEASKDDREYGYEGEMAMSQIKSIMNSSTTLMKMLKPETDLPEWVQSKITLAQDYIQTAADYMSTQVKEEAEISEAGAFSYGMKQPRKGSLKDLIAKKAREDEKNRPVIEPKDQMVGTAKVTKEDVEQVDENIIGRLYHGMRAKGSERKVESAQAKLKKAKDIQAYHSALAVKPKDRTDKHNSTISRVEKTYFPKKASKRAEKMNNEDIFSEEEIAWLKTQQIDEAHDDDGWYAHHEMHGDKGISKEDWKKGWRMNSKGQKVKLKEEAEQLDELSPNLLHRYVKGAMKDAVAGKKTNKRVQGVTSASGRLADKANKVDEDVEQIDELSKKTLGSYVKKASSDQYFKGQDVQHYSNKAKNAEGPFADQMKKKNRALADLANAKASKRDTGINRAVDRLTKEEVEQIEEASKYRETSEDPKFHTHIQKAAGSAAEGATIDFKHEDGSTTKITPAMGKKLNTMFNGMKGGPAKADAVAQAHKSSSGLTDLMAGKTAAAAKPWKPGDPLPTRYTSSTPPRKFGK